MTIRMRVLSATLRRDQPLFAIVSLSRVITGRADTSDLARFIPGSDVEVSILPAAKVQA